jgi:hypothetical protein
VLTGKNYILLGIERDGERCQSILDAQTDLEGVSSQLVHRNLVSHGTTSLVLGELCKIIHNVLSDSWIQGLEDQLRNHAVREEIGLTGEQAAEVLPLEDTG